jgi:hypothetical protein
VGLLSWLRRPVESEEAFIHAFGFKVKSGRKKLPPPIMKAQLVIFAPGKDMLIALRQAKVALDRTGYEVVGFIEESNRIRLSKWDKYLAIRCPQFVPHLPKQNQIWAVLQEEGAVVGPLVILE